MRTTSTVHSPKERLAQREMGERLALRTQWRLLACVTILRTAVTRILPLAGASAWWMTLVCLLPGLGLYWLGCLGLRITKSAVLPECARLALGKAGAWVVCILACGGLAVDAISSMTALITLFTEGVGTQGTQWTLALAAAGMLLFALNREGLARGVYFLRLPLAVLLAIVLGGWLFSAKADHLFPILGGGGSSLWAAFKAGIGMGWVFLLPLMQQPVKEKRWTEPLSPAALCVVCVLCLNLALPHELVVNQIALGDCLVLTVAHLSPFVRLMAVCLWLAALFLSIASGISLWARYALAPTGRELMWLPGVLSLALAATQWADIRWLWNTLGIAEPWLAVTLGIGAALAILACGRKQA